jgi:hypothetical protein
MVPQRLQPFANLRRRTYLNNEGLNYRAESLMLEPDLVSAETERYFMNTISDSRGSMAVTTAPQ